MNTLDLVDPGPAVEALREAGIDEADILVTLGSGYASPWEHDSLVTIAYERVPGWPEPGVHGHRGKLSLVRVEAENLMVMEGRHHYYEARSFQGVIYPLMVAYALGIRVVLLTNSAGAVRADLQPGDLVLTAGHLPFQGAAITDPAGASGVAVVRECYWDAGRRAMHEAARGCSVRLEEGVLMCVSGPAYETPAEVAMARTLGADLVAMSLAPEAVAANRIGMRAVGLSLVTNPAVSAPGRKTDHDEVVSEAQRSQPVIDRLLRACIPLLGDALRAEPGNS